MHTSWNRSGRDSKAKLLRMVGYNLKILPPTVHAICMVARGHLKHDRGLHAFPLVRGLGLKSENALPCLDGNNKRPTRSQGKGRCWKEPHKQPKPMADD